MDRIKNKILRLLPMAALAALTTGCSLDAGESGVEPILIIDPIVDVEPASPLSPTGQFVNYITSPQELIWFFFGELHLPYLDNEGKEHVSFFPDNAHADVLHVIRSRADFEAVYQGDKTLPEIDFDNYTLIIGKTYGPMGNYQLADVQLWNTGDGYQLYAQVNNYSDMTATAAFVDLFFWRLYPKLANMKVSFHRVVNEVKGDFVEEAISSDELIGMWELAKCNYGLGGSTDVSLGECTITFSDDGTARVTNSTGNHFMRGGSYDYSTEIISQKNDRSEWQHTRLKLGEGTSEIRLVAGQLVIDMGMAYDGPGYFFNKR